MASPQPETAPAAAGSDPTPSPSGACEDVACESFLTALGVFFVAAMDMEAETPEQNGVRPSRHRKSKEAKEEPATNTAKPANRAKRKRKTSAKGTNGRTTTKGKPAGEAATRPRTAQEINPNWQNVVLRDTFQPTATESGIADSETFPYRPPRVDPAFQCYVPRTYTSASRKFAHATSR